MVSRSKFNPVQCWELSSPCCPFLPLPEAPCGWLRLPSLDALLISGDMLAPECMTRGARWHSLVNHCSMWIYMEIL